MYKRQARWEPTCTCSAGDPIPCVVRDPFGGSGTVAKVGVLEHSDGEGEGIDVSPTDDGLVHAVSIDAAWNPVWFQHFAPYEWPH